MQTSRREVVDDLLTFVGAAGDTKARKRAERLLNRVLEKIWMRQAWGCFVDPDVWEITTTANTRAYALPDHFGRISSSNRIVRNLTTGREIYPRDRGDLEHDDPATGTSLEVAGPPSQYAITGSTAVQRQPSSSGDALEVVSDSASDTTVRIFVEGLTTDDLVAQRQVTINGTTPVSIGT
jgi:hypothetical protein